MVWLDCSGINASSKAMKCNIGMYINRIMKYEMKELV